MFKKKFLSFSLVLILSLLLASFAQAVISEAASWEQFQKDFYNSGQTTSPAPINNITQGWRQQVQVDNPANPMAGICVAPIVAEGKVFVLDARGRMWAFAAKTGAEVWHTDLSCTGHKFQLATPAYGEGKIFAATNDGHVYALKADDGNIIWDTPTGDTQLNTPVKYAGGKVYVGSWLGKKYYCFNASDGQLLWTRPTTTGGGYYWAGACVAGNYLVFGDESAVLTCVNKDSGELVDEKNLKAICSQAKRIRSSITYSSQTNRVYFTDQSGHCWAFNFQPQTGQLTYHWHKKIEIKDKSGNPFGFSTSTPTVYGNKIYVGTGLYTTEEHGLHCLKEEDGTEIWRFITPRFHGAQSSPALSVQNNKIYFTTTGENGSAYCIDENGNELWKFTTQEAGTSGGYILQGMAVADGWVYFGNDGGGLYALTTVDYPLTTTVDPAGSGTVELNPAGGTYPAGTTVTLTANPAAGYTFDHWSGDLSGSNNPATITMDAAKNVTAHFVEGEVTTKPDLTITDITVYDHIYVGQQTTVSANVYNIGKEDSTTFAVALYAGETLVETKQIESLVAKAGAGANFTWKPGDPGPVVLKVIVDANNEVEESNEENNQLIRQVVVLPPGGNGGGPSTITVHLQVTGKNGENFCRSDLSIESDKTVLDVLFKAKDLGLLTSVQVNYDCPWFTGTFVEGINGQVVKCGEGYEGWVYLVNDISPPKCADEVKVNNGDNILWKWSTGMEGTPGGAGEAGASPNLTVSEVEKAKQDGLKAVVKTIKEEVNIEGKALLKATALNIGITLKLEDGKVILNLPPGVGEIKEQELLLIKITPLTEDKAKEYLAKVPAGLKPLGKIYEIRATLKEQNQERPLTWKKELTLTFSYQGMEVGTAANLAGYLFNEQNKNWEPIATSKVIPEKKEVIFSVPHLSKFVLIERLKASEEKPAEEKKIVSFKDLPDDHWAKEIIEFMAAKGIFKGYPDGTCRPAKVVNRAEFASLLLRTLKLKEEEKTVAFNDVQPGNWFYRTVATAYRYGLVKGYAAAGQRFGEQAEKKYYFRPHHPVTREQVAVMLIRALEHEESEKEDGGETDGGETKVKQILARFNDRGKISAWAKEAVSRAIRQEIIQGYPGNLLSRKPEQPGPNALPC